VGTVPYIDHMHLDDTGAVEILFGSSRSNERMNSGDQIHIWKVNLDPTTHNPIPGSLTVTHIKIDDMKDQSHIIALKPVLVNGELHGMWWKEDKKIFYWKHDWTT